MNWIWCLDIVVLALMLAYVVVVGINASSRYYLVRRRLRTDAASQDLKKLATDLRIKARTLKAVASIAPFLGLAGTCLGVMNIFRGVGEIQEVQTMMISTVAAAPLTAALGILVAVPAVFFSNYFCTRIDSLESELADCAFRHRRQPAHARRFLLTKRFSQLPSFGLIAALGLTLLVKIWMPLFGLRGSKGLPVELAPARCKYGDFDRLLVLRVTDGGQVFLNKEQEDWNGLADRLSEIYQMREDRTIYFFADEGASFQNVADAIDIASPYLKVRLITPRTANTPCLEPSVTDSKQHAPR
jgi:biopolymer transport protein ExbB